METTKAITLDAQQVNHYLAGARQTGVDLDQLLEKSGISHSDLQTPGTRLPVEKVVKLTKYCVTATEDEMSGLLAKPIPLGHIRLTALSAVHAGTLGRAIVRHLDFNNLYKNSLLWALKVRGEQAEIVVTRIPGDRIADNFAIESLLASIHRFIGWLGNERIIPSLVKFDFPAPEYSAEYRYFFYGSPVLCEQDCISLQFDASYLEHSIVQTEASVESYVRRMPLDLYLPFDACGEITQAIRKKIKDGFAKDNTPPNQEQLANAMQVSLQTLRRRLKSEGSSFHDIKAQVRRDIATQYLGHADISIEAVAEKAGYTEPSAFIRAFKTWTGFTPLQFRKGVSEKDS